jgi:hypothetical protein
MKTDTPKATTTTGLPEREALASSEKKASEEQPGSYKDKETAEKVVTIPPAGPGKKPIRGLDS